MNPEDEFPELIKMEAVGDKTVTCDKEWPTKEDVSKLPLDKTIKLNRIRWKKNGYNQPITGIGLEFTNGVKSPLF